jgi:hypothetical protein
MPLTYHFMKKYSFLLLVLAFISLAGSAQTLKDINVSLSHDNKTSSVLTFLPATLYFRLVQKALCG